MPRRKPNAAPGGKKGRSADPRSDAPLPSFRTFATEAGPDGDEEYTVVSVPGMKATKPYRCPGCDHEIRVGEPHVVAWPAFDASAGERRHWHRSCWQARGRRGPVRRW
ncbi:MAG: ATP/GTP-binding protein [Segniliparus sp.]|uniref:ATP/GTP-binding protein n=1 Tax=Segniliparus sp. TaxID=2804064 RepID=UPI003F2A3A36